MALGLGLAAVGALGGGLGLRKKSQYINTLSPEQQQVSSALTRNLTQGSPTYGGQLSAGITQGEEDAVARSARLAAMSEQGLMNTQYNPLTFNENFQREVMDPQLQYFQSRVAPLIDEALPTFSTARGGERGKALSDLQGQLLQTRFNAREGALNRTLEGALGAPGAASTYAQTAQIPRMIQQAGLDREYQKFLDQNQSRQADLNAALQFLGVETQAYQPGTSFAEGALAGAGIGASVGLAYDTYQQNKERNKILQQYLGGTV